MLLGLLGLYGLGQSPEPPLHFRTPRIERFGRQLAIDRYGVRFKYPESPVSDEATYLFFDLRPSSGPERSIPFGQFEVGFTGFIGDPKRPPFVVKRSGMRIVLYDVFLPGYRWIPSSFRYVVQITQKGVLGGRSLSSLCFIDSTSLKIRWERSFGVGLKDVTPGEDSIRIELEGGRVRHLSWTTGMNL